VLISPAAYTCSHARIRFLAPAAYPCGSGEIMARKDWPPLAGVALPRCSLSTALLHRADSGGSAGLEDLSWELEEVELDGTDLIRRRSSG
jgi:hypothetical protein